MQKKGNKWNQNSRTKVRCISAYHHLRPLITYLRQVSYGLLIVQVKNAQYLMEMDGVLPIAHFNEDPELEQLINGNPMLGSIFIEHPLFHSCSGHRCQHVQHLQCIFLCQWWKWPASLTGSRSWKHWEWITHCRICGFWTWVQPHRWRPSHRAYQAWRQAAQPPYPWSSAPPPLPAASLMHLWRTEGGF